MRPAAPACHVLLRCLGVLLGTTLLMVIALAPAAAQKGDLEAIVKRYDQLFAAGNYPAALVEAQKLEAAVKARVGVNNAIYGLALHNLANVYLALGKYADAEGVYQRVLAF